MAINASTIWAFDTGATANMVNGGGFNTANANFFTDLTTDTNTANTSAPVVSSASYNFVAGDVGAWLYVKTGTNWLPGFYQISSVASNKATVNATIGQAVQFNATTQMYAPSTVVGVATVGTPTGGTWGVDFSQGTAAITTQTDFAAVGASTTLTSVSAPFRAVFVGNIFHQTTTGTGAFGVVGWYEIVSYVNTTTVVLDRAPNNGTASVACTGFVGGALTMSGSLNDSFWEQIQGGNITYIKNGTYSLGSNTSVASTNSTKTAPSYVYGFNSIRGDNPLTGSRPIIACSSQTFNPGQYVFHFFIQVTTTTSTGFAIGIGGAFIYSKITNTSTSSTRPALTCTGGNALVFAAEAVSQNGSAIACGTSPKLIGCYVHDSNIGILHSSSSHLSMSNIIESCRTTAIEFQSTSGVINISSCTLYGSEAKVGTGILFGASTGDATLTNNIFYGFSTGINQTTAALKSNMGMFNDFFNNTTNATNYTISASDLALDPQFTAATQLTGSTATTSGSVLTQSGGDFSTVTDNVDYLRVVSGTGVTTGIYLITSHTSTTLTVNNALGTSSAGDVVWVVPTGHNLSIGTNLKGQGFPGVFPGSETTGYLDIGAAQRQEQASGSTGFLIF